MAIQPTHDPMERIPLQAREVLRLLETVPLLGDMATRERAVLAEVAEVVRCVTDVELFGIGQEVRWWYLVLNGRVEETVGAPDGTRQVVREATAGQSVGLDSVLSGMASATQVTSVMTSSFVRVPVPDLLRLLRGTGPVSIKLQTALNEELGRDLRAATLAMVDLVT